MSASGSVTHWIEQIREGDPVAAQAVWERYFPELVRLAGEKLHDVPRRAAGEEDIASSVMESLFRAARQGRFPNLADRHELWRSLLGITARKVVAIMAEEYQRLLERLADPDLQALAVAKMEGYTNEEIAERFDCSVRTIERRLRLIRKKWQQEQPP
jgi:hypothetical protein